MRLSLSIRERCFAEAAHVRRSVTQALSCQFQNTSSSTLLMMSALKPQPANSSNTLSTHFPMFSSPLNNPVISSLGTLATSTRPPYFFHLVAGPQTSTMTLPPTLILKSLIMLRILPPNPRSNKVSSSGILSKVLGTSIFSTKALLA